ncbi:MAG TPA: hypothetical protein VGQ28_14230, partial [Thermoanaerobaculia bacterium]|nr:hypothetical protein [Thermoanaerobaculia bacterium]
VKAFGFDRETGKAVKASVSVSDQSFFQQLATDTGGIFQLVFDNGPLPPPFAGSSVDIPALDARGIGVMILVLCAAAIAFLRRRRQQRA